MGMASFMMILSQLIFFGIIFFAIYVVITILKLMKQKNEYLKEIRDELKKDKSNR